MSGDPIPCPLCGVIHRDICPRTVAGSYNPDKTFATTVFPEYVVPAPRYQATCADCGLKADEVFAGPDVIMRCVQCANRKFYSSMNHDDLVVILTEYLRDEVFARRFAGCMTMIRQKNADYTQGTAKRDRIGAFRRIGGDIDVPMAKVWAIFAQKHWGAVMKYVKDGQVESEPISGRIDDLINYFVLLGAIIEDGK